MAAVDATRGGVESPEERLVSELTSGLTPFKSGDVLVAKITPCFENGKIAQAITDTEVAYGSTEFHVVRAKPDTAHQRYLFHYLRQQSVRSAGERRMTGSAGQRRVPEAFLRELKVPLPPLDEQRRIAGILDAADEVRAKRHESLALLDSLTEAIFLDMFGDPVVNDRGWDESDRLGEVADVGSGITKGRKLRGQATRSVPYLAVANVQAGFLRLDSVKTIDATEVEIARYRLRAGDILLTEGGDPDKLGRGTLWAGEIPECIHQNHVFRVRLNDGRYVPEYVSWLLGSARGRRYFLRSAKQTTGIASINKSQLAAFPLLRPPRELQNRFVDALGAQRRSVVGLASHRAQIDALFASLQHRAFRGEL